MRALRPLLRSCHRAGNNRAVGPLPCRPFRGCAVPAFRLHYRTQHNQHGPHKEYFQVPGQEPKPDLTPYTREPQSSLQMLRPSEPYTSSIVPNQTQHVPDQRAQPQPTGWLRVPRIVRSVVWFLLFLQLGAAAGTALVTWEYLSPPFEPGSEEDQDLIDDILYTMDMHPMIQDLRDNEWIEVPPIAIDPHHMKGRNLVTQVLGGNNTQGIFLRQFHHPSQEFTMLVFFFGFGVEGWPDVIHGGMISTMLEEGLSQHLAFYYPDYFTTPDSKTKIDFKKPCQPGNIYGVLVAPSGRKATTSGNVHVTELQMTGLLVQMAGAPAVTTEFDMSSNTEVHTVGIPAQAGEQPTHAICEAAFKIVPRQVIPNGQSFEVGGQDDGGFGRALDYLKKRPEFKNSQPPPPSSEDSDDKDKD